MPESPNSEILVSLSSMRPRIEKMGGDRYGEDLFGEVCEKALKDPDGKYSHPGSICKIAKNTLVNFMRKNGRRQHMPLNSLPELQYKKGLDPFHELQSKEQDEIVRREVDRLQPHYREIINLLIEDKLSDQQIADRLGISIGTARTRKKRAKELLKAALRPHWPR